MTPRIYAHTRPCFRCGLYPRAGRTTPYCRACRKIYNQSTGQLAAARKARGRARLARWMKERNEN